MSDSVQYIFSYGTLQDPKVQAAVFGRRVPLLPDQLPGFTLDRVRIVDADVIAKSGSDEQPILRRSSAPGASVVGSALAIEPEDIAKADAYEVADYRRIQLGDRKRLDHGSTFDARVAKKVPKFDRWIAKIEAP